jgi:positive regulator of sigma E activity
MLTESAQVVETKGRRAMVRTHRGEACSSCQAAGACKALGGGKEMIVEALNHVQARSGDRVLLALPEGSFVKASAVTHVIPLVGFLAGAILGRVFAADLGWSLDAASVILAFIGLALSIPVVILMNRVLSVREHYIPRIIQVLPQPAAGGGARATPGACQI